VDDLEIGDLDVAHPYDSRAALDTTFFFNGGGNVWRQSDDSLGVLAQGRGSDATSSPGVVPLSSWPASSANPLIFIGDLRPFSLYLVFLATGHARTPTLLMPSQETHLRHR
jgi:hypothetical protein